jgi:hypothetical protein
VNRSQLELALVLAAPANRVFLVGDDEGRESDAKGTS